MSTLSISKDHCPYCGEPIRLIIDESIGETSYIEDCEVCCRPIVIKITDNTNELEITLLTEDD